MRRVARVRSSKSASQAEEPKRAVAGDTSRVARHTPDVDELPALLTPPEYIAFGRIGRTAFYDAIRRGLTRTSASASKSAFHVRRLRCSRERRRS